MGLPVRRSLGAGHKKIVLARTSDLDTWMAMHWQPRDPDENQVRQKMGQEIVTDLNQGTRRARDLRKANHTLLQQMHALVQELIKNSYELNLAGQDTVEETSGNN